MITLNRFDWNTGKDVPHKANDEAVEAFVNFFLNSKAWHEDIELVHKKVRKLRADGFGEERTKKPKPTS
jgi:hypothetical protein